MSVIRYRRTIHYSEQVAKLILFLPSWKFLVLCSLREHKSRVIFPVKGDTSKSQAQGGENAAQTKKEQRRNTWTNEDGSIRPISKWSGVSFTDQQKADYVAGKAVKLENVTDKQGFHATMYIKFNPEKGRPYRYDTNPDNAQQVAPSNESRTQVAVNNDGKTNEATKNLREPLQKGQTNPKDARQQQQQEKPQKKTGKGMKM